MSDVAAASAAAESAVGDVIKVGGKIVVDRGPCLLCQLPVWSNQSRGVTASGYYHAACLLEVGECQFCDKKVYNFEMHGYNDFGNYHVDCIGEFHKECHMCKENVYKAEKHAFNTDKTKCYHARCLGKVRAKCIVCDNDISWRDKRIELSSGEMVHEGCKVKKTRIINPQPKGQRQFLGNCAVCAKSLFKDELGEKNDKNQYMHAVCIVNQVPAVEHAVTKVFVPQQINVGARKMVPLFAEPGVPRVEKKVVEKKVGIKGICPFWRRTYTQPRNVPRTSRADISTLHAKNKHIRVSSLVLPRNHWRSESGRPAWPRQLLRQSRFLSTPPLSLLSLRVDPS